MRIKVWVILIIAAALLLIFSGSALAFEAGGQEHLFRGRVLEVNEQDAQEQMLGIEQNITIRLLNGPFKGETVTIQNYYAPEGSFYDLRIREGMEIILVSYGENPSLEQLYVFDLVRSRGIYLLIVLFVIALLLVGRMKGLQTLITLIATGALIVKFFLPNLLKGHNPILLAVIVSSLVVIFTLLVVGGINRKSYVAIIGTMTGIIVAGLLAWWVGNISYLTGFSTHEAQMLYYLTERPLDIRGLLFAGIIIGSLGAITDIGISVASAAAEVKAANPAITVKELTAAALNVGRDVLGTMANTLILAYVGAATPLLLLVVGYEMSWTKLINLDLIATEFVRGLAGSAGLIAAVPVTALLAGYFMGRGKEASPEMQKES